MIGGCTRNHIPPFKGTFKMFPLNTHEILHLVHNDHAKGGAHKVQWMAQGRVFLLSERTRCHVEQEGMSTC